MVTEYRRRKLKLPVFDDEDPNGWIFKAERYFSINQIGEDEMMEATVVCLEGEALAWFQWEKKMRKLQN